MRLVAFHGETIAAPAIEVSTDGVTFLRVAVAMTKATPLASFPKVKQLAGMRRTMSEYEAEFEGVAPRYVRMVWAGEMELDRIEIEHAGAP